MLFLSVEPSEATARHEADDCHDDDQSDDADPGGAGNGVEASDQADRQ